MFILVESHLPYPCILVATPAFPSSEPLISGPLCLCTGIYEIQGCTGYREIRDTGIYEIQGSYGMDGIDGMPGYMRYRDIRDKGSRDRRKCESRISLYPVLYPCIPYIPLSHIFLYPVYPCIPYNPVSRISLYPVYSCIPFIFDTSILEPIRPFTSLAPVALKQSRCVKILRET